jgi:hypothetical protein
VHAARVVRGCPTTPRHVPTEPLSAHASHCPSHATSQQTPSAQKPLAHSWLAPHVAPFALFVTHFPPLQKAVDAQSVSAPHVEAQTPAVHVV